MHTIKFDLVHGSISVGSTPISINENGVLTKPIARLCTPPFQTDEDRTRYRLLSKASICGKSADGMIEVSEARVYAVIFLFDSIEFFESSILESKTLKACEKSLNLNFESNHPTTAFLEFCEWGWATFFYDAKQGDLSLNITFQCSSNEPTQDLMRRNMG